MTDAPKIPGKTFDHDTRLRKLVVSMAHDSNNPGDRGRFTHLLDLLRTPTGQNAEAMFPTGQRADGRAMNASRLAVVYSALLKALRMRWAEWPPVDIEPVLAYAEKAASATTFWITGDVGLGYEMVFEKPAE